LRLLEKHAFIVTSNTPTILMVEVDKLAGVLEAFKEAKLAASIAFLRGMPSVDGSSSNNQVDPLFPDSIPTCPISSEELEGAYSIISIAPSLCKPATKWGKQLAALEKWKKNPPLNSHDRVKKVGETSIQLMVRSLEEYMGFCYKHLDLEPSMDLVMQCSTFSQFMAFKQARGNESSTMLRAAQQVSLTIAFVMSGKCPQVKAYSPGHAAQCKQWYSNLKADYRREVAEAPTKRKAISLAAQWEAVDGRWNAFIEKYEVSLSTQESNIHAMERVAWDKVHKHQPSIALFIVQENGKAMNDVLAHECQSAGLQRILAAKDSPPSRVGALGAIHKYGKIDGVECIVCK
jgi:hypothetical protein